MKEKEKQIIKMETWQPVKGYENLYEVSNYGKIKSLNRLVNGRWGKTNISEKILKEARDKNDYLIVTLCKNGRQKSAKIHRLVAQAFIPNPNNLPEINHKDENKQNNCVDNLEWCTHKYNNNYGTRLERLSKTRGKKVNQYDLDGNYIQTFYSVNYAEKITKIKHIYDCCNGKLKTAGKYVWRYEQ